MKVIKSQNYKTNEFYFAVVEDDDHRTDPLELFSADYVTKTPNHIALNVNSTIIKIGITKEAASAELIIQRRLNPSYKKVIVEKTTKPENPKEIKVIVEPKEETLIKETNKKDK